MRLLERRPLPLPFFFFEFAAATAATSFASPTITGWPDECAFNAEAETSAPACVESICLVPLSFRKSNLGFVKSDCGVYQVMSCNVCPGADAMYSLTSSHLMSRSVARRQRFKNPFSLASELMYAVSLCSQRHHETTCRVNATASYARTITERSRRSKRNSDSFMATEAWSWMPTRARKLAPRRRGWRRTDASPLSTLPGVDARLLPPMLALLALLAFDGGRGDDTFLEPPGVTNIASVAYRGNATGSWPLLRICASSICTPRH